MERYIEIPEEVRDVYKLWRPTPMYRAWRLEKELQTPARIYYKCGAAGRGGRAGVWRAGAQSNLSLFCALLLCGAVDKAGGLLAEGVFGSVGDCIVSCMLCRI